MLEHDVIREQILRILYEHQEAYPRSHGILERQLIDKLGGVDISFALYYLEQKGYVAIRGQFVRITGDGIDALEKIDRQRILDMGKRI